MHGNWIIVGALCGPDDAIFPALALLPATEIQIEDVWHTDGMCATGWCAWPTSIPGRRPVQGCTTPTPTAGRWCPRWPCWRPCPRWAALSAAEIYAERLSQRVLAYKGVVQKAKPIAQAHLAEGRVRLRALRNLLADTVGASAHFLDNPLQRIKRDVDVISGHAANWPQPSHWV